MGLGAFAVFEPDASQLATGPGIEALQVPLASGLAEVGHPYRKEAIELGDHARETDAPVAPGDPPDPLLRAGEALGRDAQ